MKTTFLLFAQSALKFFGHGCGVICNIHIFLINCYHFCLETVARTLRSQRRANFSSRAHQLIETPLREAAESSRETRFYSQGLCIYMSWFCFPLYCSVAVFLLNSAASRVTCSPLALSRGWRPPKCRWKTCVRREGRDFKPLDRPPALPWFYSEGLLRKILTCHCQSLNSDWLSTR